MGREKINNVLASRASELLATARAARAKPCLVGVSKNRGLIDEMVSQGGSARLIEGILRDIGDPIAASTLRNHAQKSCLCYRDDYHRVAAARRAARQ